MIANRRMSHNFSLDRAIELAKEQNKPLVVLEALRLGYQWASERLHAFILEGMLDNMRDVAGADTDLTYLAYVEREIPEGKGLLEHLAKDACAIVTDDFPCFMLPKMTAAAAGKVNVKMEMVDSNGLYPMRIAPQVFLRAYDFRRHLQKELKPHFKDFPEPAPLEGLKLGKAAVDTGHWPIMDEAGLEDARSLVKELDLDHTVKPVDYKGGRQAALEALSAFKSRFKRYGEDRNHPDDDVASGLSVWLHFGHISTHEIFNELVPNFKTSQLAAKANGARAGWWGLEDHAESFLDELITWRELGFNMCALRPDDYYKYESLPDWAQQTLEEHASDPREWVYSLEEFEKAQTHDDVWNAAQNQLIREGRIHNYLRMLWGKKILHWSESPQVALEIMVELNNKYAVDGRDPNSYSGIFWVLGRYDRAWGPEREIFGKIRYMTSESAMSKLRMKEYVKRYTARQGSLL